MPDRSNGEGGTKRRPRVLLVDPAFGGRGEGHHRRLNAAYAARIGLDRCWIAANRSLGPVDGIPADRLLRCFSISYYEAGERRRRGPLGRLFQAVAYRDDTPVPAPVRRWLQSALRRRRGRPGEAAARGREAGPASIYAEELGAAIDGLALGPHDHLVFTSLDAEMGRAVLDLAAVRGAAALPALHLRLMYDEGSETASALGYAGLLERLAASGCVGGRVQVYCETEVHARTLSERLGAPVAAAPYPAAALEPPAPLAGRPLTIGYFGEARREKGFDLLEPVVEAFGRRHPDLERRVRWRFHAGGRTIETAAARDRLRSRDRPPAGDVAYRFGVLDADAYERMRAEADIVLAPQDPGVYALRGSGVAQEAAAGGRPLVCLAGSSLAVEPDAEVLAAENVEGLADALARVVRDPGPWLEAAARRAERFRRRLYDSPLFARLAEPAPQAEDPPVALVVGPWWPQGGSARLMALQAETLTGLGYQVARIHLCRPGEAAGQVLARALAGPQRDRSTMISRAVPAAPGRDGAWSAAPADPLIDALCRSGRVGLVVTNFLAASVWTARLPLGAGVRRVLETHELRLDPATGRALDAPPPAFGPVDAAVFVNAEEMADWQGPGARLIVPPLDDRAGSTPGLQEPPFDLLFVGSDHARNRRALDRLCTDILTGPQGRALALTVVGGVSSEAAEARPATRMLGQVADLEPLYAAARLVVVPHTPGGGLPSKVLGPLARGKALVADAGAVAFLPGRPAFAAEDAGGFRAMVLRAMTDGPYRESLARASRAAWASIAAPGAHARRWAEMLADIGAPAPKGSPVRAKRV